MNFFRKALTNPKAITGFVLMVAAVFVAIAAPLLTPYAPGTQNLDVRLAPPFWMENSVKGHLLGTDALGQDLLTQMIYGSRVSLIVATFATVLSAFLGTLLGLVSSYFGGIVDQIVTRLVEMQLSFPYLLLAVTVLAITEPSIFVVVLVLGLSGWPTMCRVVRGRAMALMERDFVKAAKTMGARGIRILLRYLLPNVLSVIMVIIVTQMAQFIIAEATLSFLGLGVPPTVPSWGGIINAGQNYIWEQWWLTTFPGVAIILLVSGLGLFGDWLRDYLDPTLRV